MSSVEWRSVSFAFPDGQAALRDASASVDQGDVLLVAGASGSGKSTLLRTVVGLVPHASGGSFSGDVVVAGASITGRRPRELAGIVGFVHQDPEAQFVVDEVEADVAFALENLGVDARTMRRRVEEVLDAVGIAHLRSRSPASLSGGERQRAAIAGALAAAPEILVLDEPTAQLDPQGTDDVLAAVARTNTDLGATVLLAEHRLDRAVPLADAALWLESGEVLGHGKPAATLAAHPGTPSVTRLGRLLGWDPPPFTVRDARRWASRSPLPPHKAPSALPSAVHGEVTVALRRGAVALGGRSVLRDVDLELHEGEIVALLGRNGAGKTTLLRALAGLVELSSGVLSRRGRVGYVPQDSGALLSARTVREELRTTARLVGAGADEPEGWLDALGLTELAERHPRSLSSGQRQRVAIAAVAVGGHDVLLLDEPTRGIDAASRERLHDAVCAYAARGNSVVMATHDVELAARCATTTVVLGDGDIVAAGPAREVLAGSLFAPQVLRVLPPFLTVEEVADAMVRP